MNLPFQIKRLSQEVLTDLAMVKEIAAFIHEAHITHAQKNGLAMFVEQKIDKIETLTRAIAGYGAAMESQGYAKPGDPEELPF